MVHSYKHLSIFLDMTSQVFENELVKQNANLNDIVKFYMVVSLASLPFIITSGLFGMNCNVPG